MVAKPSASVPISVNGDFGVAACQTCELLRSNEADASAIHFISNNAVLLTMLTGVLWGLEYQQMSRFRIDALLLLCVLTFVGCTSRAPDKPELCPDEAGAKAVEMYDSDQNGSINESEAEASPGLLAAFEKVDKDGDGELTADEISARVLYFKTATSWVIPGACRITYRGRPLEGATVTFEPEPFLGPSFAPCSGTTDRRGEAYCSRPGGEIEGIYLGFYRVRVTRPKKNGDEMLPAKYNEETTLGFEANNDVPEIPDFIHFKLK